MNFFKNVIPLIVLLCINSINAKRMGSTATKPAPAPAAKTPVIQQPAVRQPITSSFAKATADTQERSYKDLVNYIKNASNVWDRANARLKSEFNYDLIKKANLLKLDNVQLEALLQTARDVHGIFTGNQAKDKNILTTIEDQIQAAISQRQNL